MSSILEQAFGTTKLDLYQDILHVAKDCSPAQLRKAYYQQALQYHPDKNPSADAKLKFQAISWVYNLLKDPQQRADYDTTGVVPGDDELDNDSEGSTVWKEYFDTIFGKLSTDDIDQFAMKYKMSEEEERDVLHHYEKYKGNLSKMLEFVILSEERDVPRWIEDYINPALKAGKLKPYHDTMQKTLKQINKKLAKAKEQEEQEEQEGDELNENETDETETEESDKEMPSTSSAKKKKKQEKQKPAPKRAKPTKAKSRQSSQADLIAAIRNKNRSTNPLAAIGARYGVAVDDDDPLDDAAFAKIQSKLKKKKK